MRIVVEAFQSFPGVADPELATAGFVFFGLDDIEVIGRRVEQLEQAPAVADSHTIDTFSLHGEVCVGAVDDVQGQLAVADFQGDIDKGFVKAVIHCVFEPVLDKGNEQEGFDHLTAGLAFYGKPDIGIMSHLFDVDIVPDEFDLFIQRDLFLVAFIDEVTHDVCESYHYFRGLVGLLQGEGINAVQRIEEEMGIELGT